jgi:hypothetical protein
MVMDLGVCWILSHDHFEGEIKVVMVTSSVDRADKRKATLYPMIIDFVEKPLNKEAATIKREVL